MAKLLRRLTAALCTAALALSLCACGPSEEPEQRTLLAMDTAMTFTIYGDNAARAADEAAEYLYALERALDVTDEKSEIYALNHAAGAQTPVSADTRALVSEALRLCRATGGALDITAYPAVRAWGFTTGAYRVPEQGELDELLPLIDHTRVAVGKDTLTLPEGMMLDLGAVAKGYAGRELAAMLKAAGITSATLSLGGNVQAIGAKPDGSPWRVGIQDPNTEGYLAIVAVEDKAVVTSGGYQRYFTVNGIPYWHIIDPATAAPARSGLLSVTVVGEDGLVCDGLSTALFVMGLDRAADYWRAHRDFEAVFIGEDGSIAITAGLQGSFTLAEGYTHREVEVLE